MKHLNTTLRLFLVLFFTCCCIVKSAFATTTNNLLFSISNQNHAIYSTAASIPIQVSLIDKPQLQSLAATHFALFDELGNQLGHNETIDFTKDAHTFWLRNPEVDEFKLTLVAITDSQTPIQSEFAKQQITIYSLPPIWINPAPVVRDDYAIVKAQQQVNISVLENDFYTDHMRPDYRNDLRFYHKKLNIHSYSLPKFGTLTKLANNTFVYEQNRPINCTDGKVRDSFSYMVSDDQRENLFSADSMAQRTAHVDIYINCSDFEITMNWQTISAANQFERYVLQWNAEEATWCKDASGNFQPTSGHIISNEAMLYEQIPDIYDAKAGIYTQQLFCGNALGEKAWKAAELEVGSLSTGHVGISSQWKTNGGSSSYGYKMTTSIPFNMSPTRYDNKIIERQLSLDEGQTWTNFSYSGWGNINFIRSLNKDQSYQFRTRACVIHDAVLGPRKLCFPYSTSSTIVKTATHRPVAYEDVVEINSGDTVTIDILDNDFDIQALPLRINDIASMPSKGSLTVTGNQVTYAHDSTNTCPSLGVDLDTFTYRANSDNGQSKPEEVYIKIRCNPIPEGIPDQVSVVQSGTLLVDVLANDPLNNHQIQKLELFSLPRHVIVTPVKSGDSWLLEISLPESIDFSNDSFDYIIVNALGQPSLPVKVFLTNPTSGLIAKDDQFQLSIADTASSHALDILLNDQLGESITLSEVIITSEGTRGAVQASIENHQVQLTYTSPGDYYGVDTFSYKLRSTNGLESNTALVTLNLTEQNLPPVANNDLFPPFVASSKTLTLDVLANDSDPNANQALTIVDFSTSNAIADIDVVNNKIEYTVHSNWCGENSFEYQITDGEFSSTATAVVTIDCQPELLSYPVTEFSIPEGIQSHYGVFELTIKDEDIIKPQSTQYQHGPTMIMVYSQSEHPDLHVWIELASTEKQGRFNLSTYRVNMLKTQDFPIADRYPIKISIRDKTNPDIQLTVHGSPHNLPPHAAADEYFIDSGDALQLSPLINDTDPDDDYLLISSVTSSQYGQVSISSDRRKLDYVAPQLCSGDAILESFNYTIEDQYQEKSSAQIKITVNCPQPLLELALAKNTYLLNETATFNWQGVNVHNCTLTIDQANFPISPSGNFEHSFTSPGNKLIQLDCDSHKGAISTSKVINITTAQLSVETAKQQAYSGEGVLVSWNTGELTNCSLDTGLTTIPVSQSGSTTVQYYTLGNQHITLTCSTGGVNNSASTQLQIAPLKAPQQLRIQTSQ